MQKKQAFFAAGVMFFTTLLCNLAVMLISRQGIVHEVQHHLASIAAIAARQTNGDVHATITLPEQKSSEAYRALQQPYIDILKSDPELYYVYTCIIRDGKVYFIVDVPPINAQESQAGIRTSSSEIMEYYPDATPKLLEALTQKKTVVENDVYTDEWGTFLSAYAPFYNSKGEFQGVVGTDIEASEFQERLGWVWAAFGVGGGISLVMAMVVYWVVLRRHEERLQQENGRQERLGLTDLFLEEIKHFAVSLTRMAEAIHGSTEGISRIASQSAESTSDAQNDIRGASGRIVSIQGVCEELLHTAGTLQEEARSWCVATQQVQEELKASDTQTQKLVEVSQRISKMLGMISDITDRIDLLALNATIEAARAGEAGKGFAVVAEEVKILSQQTAETTFMIGKYAAEIEEASGGVVALFKNTRASVEKFGTNAARASAAADGQRDLIAAIASDIAGVSEGVTLLESRVEAVSAITHETEMQTFKLFEAAKGMAKENKALNDNVTKFLSDIKKIGE